VIVTSGLLLCSVGVPALAPFRAANNILSVAFLPLRETWGGGIADAAGRVDN